MIERLTGRATSRAFGETVTITPMQPGAHTVAAGPDPARPERQVVACFNSAPDDIAIFEDRNEGQTAIGGARVVVGAAWLTVSAEVMISLGYEVVKDDVVTLSDRPGAPTYTVSMVAPHDLGGALLHLAKG